MWGVVVGALGVWFGLAIAIGHRLDREARESAWQRIATSRRLNHDAARQVAALRLTLQVRKDALDRREKRLDLREAQLNHRELLLERSSVVRTRRTSRLTATPHETQLVAINSCRGWPLGASACRLRWRSAPSVDLAPLDRTMFLLENTVSSLGASVEDVQELAEVFAELADSALDPECARGSLREVMDTL